MKKTKKGLLGEASRLAGVGIFYFAVIAAVFIALNLVMYGIFAILWHSAGAEPGPSSNVVYLNMVYYAVAAFLLGLYIATLYASVGYLEKNTNVHYLDSIGGALKKMAVEKNTTFAIIGFGMFAGLLPTIYGTYAGMAAPGAVGLLIVGVLLAVVSGVSVSGFSNTCYCTDFPTMLGRIRKNSPGSAAFIYASILIAVVPFSWIVQMIMLPFSVSIVAVSTEKDGKILCPR